jgi:hypothetical protein
MAYSMASHTGEKHFVIKLWSNSHRLIAKIAIDNNILRLFELSAHDGCGVIIKYYHFTHVKP